MAILFLTVGDIVGLLDVHPETVRRWLRVGLLDGRLLGGRYVVRVSALSDFTGIPSHELLEELQIMEEEEAG